MDFIKIGEYPCIATEISSGRQLTIFDIVVSVSCNVQNKTWKDENVIANDCNIQ